MDLNNKNIQWAILVLLAFTWGSSFILMKLSLRTFDLFQVAGFRIFLSFILFLPLTIRNFKKITKHNLPFLLIVGFIGNTIPAFLFTIAQTKIESSMAGILNSLTPLSTLLIGLYLFKEKSSLINVIGVFIALMGAMGLMIKTDLQTFFAGANWFGLFVVLAASFYGISVNVIKHKLKNLDGIAIASLSFFVTGPICGIILLFTDFEPVFASKNAANDFLYILALAFFSSVLAVIAFNILIKYTTAIFASSVTYIIPIFAIMWGIIYGEQLIMNDLLWAVIVILGVYLVNLKKNKKIEL
ncbi:MAG: DMT family transporter [Bacteroidales bacterium]|nr:DMT family transporter [Bacteroidales bacterium]